MVSWTLVTGCGQVTNTFALENGTSVLSGMSVRNECNGTARPSSGDIYRTCHNGSWTGSPLNCSNCSPPENGTNTILYADWLYMDSQQEDYGGGIVPEGVTASYRCLEGYFLSSGDACRRCERGYWTGNPPACHRACLPPEPGTNVVMNNILQNFSMLLDGCNSAVWVGGSYPHETVLRYQCSQGRAHSAGTLNRTCENGLWSGHAPSCQVEPGISSPPRFRQRDRSNVYLMTVEGVWYIKNVDDVSDVVLKKSQNTSDPPIEPGWFHNIPNFGLAWVYDASVRLECIPGTCIHTYEYPGRPRVVSNGTTTEYSCLPGYHLFGGNTINTCLGGEFTGTTPVCKECCSAPRNVTTSSLALVNTAVPAGMGCMPNTDTSMASGTLYPSGSMAIYTCWPGLVLQEGNSSRTCHNGTWSGAEAVCGVPRCSLLPLVEHANLTVFRPIHDDDNSTDFFINGTEAHYSCHTGYYRTSGNTYRKCENGYWTGISPTCSDRCVIPPPGKNVEYEYDESPINGSVPIDTTAYGTCLPGHNLDSGQLCRKCEAASWSGARPICARHCGALGPVPHANLWFVSPFGRFTCGSSFNQRPDNGEHLSGTQVTYTCQDGYTYQNGSLTRTCYNGAWSGTPLECRGEPPPATTTDTGANTSTSDHTLVTTPLTDQASAITTTSTSALETTPVSLSSTLSTQNISTDPRTQTGGRTTGTNLALTSDVQTTEHVTVTLPPNCLLSHLGGNEIVIQGVTHGNAANVVDIIYTCNTGFRFPDLSAQKTSKCFNGDWLNNVPCEVVTCPVLAVPQYASIDNSNVTYRSMVKITCQLGYWFDDGFNELITTCTQNGSWNITNVPLCKIAVCPPPLEKVTSQLVTNNFTTYVYNMTVDYICVNDSFFVDSSTVRRSRCNAYGMWSLKYIPDCSM
ncbi:sushi, von Willebrand factor type A, EGF and pentraxin domain-containing protein 1-like [Lingula anatina]|uniref:Sushi, von Willebrand factor type A, EGF and pentraxin domain-containing protein 1-like n=1 Tax=Lingula anatina TaxID=7574 RepID=A0A2R2MPK1_LINAN|nr:sushi, von Willebrand factor type A, EGF and pentraxin domain-containing protein 1-like [Lingula anatina]|eukprot:XP_023931942.1 sushi, von Willebrand factor type A, EGF and pentraxin domain-containing protein 1-like [Lingula anatina]